MGESSRLSRRPQKSLEAVSAETVARYDWLVERSVVSLYSVACMNDSLDPWINDASQTNDVNRQRMIFPSGLCRTLMQTTTATGRLFVGQ